PAEVETGYCHGLFSRIGAGPYDRRRVGVPAVADPLPRTRIAGGSAIALPNALAGLDGTGTVVVTDGRTLTATADVAGVRELTVRAADAERSVIRPAAGAAPWVFTGDGGTLRLEGLLISGADLVLRGSFERVELSCCTLDPGNSGALRIPAAVWDSGVDGRELRPVTVWVEGRVRSLVLDRCITGPVRTRTGGLVEHLAASDSILQGLPGEPAGTLDHLRDADGMLSALKHRRDELSHWLAGTMDAQTAIVLAGHADHTEVPAAAAQRVLAGLQAVIAGPLLWTATRFADRPLSDQTAATIADPPADPTELARLNRRLLAEAYPLALADAALATEAGTVELVRCTVLGDGFVHQLEAGESVLDGVFRVRNAQAGCVRFSAWATGSALPRRYESVQIAPGAPVFLSRRYGEWGYGQLHDGADSAVLGGNTGGPASLLTGSHDGSEMGVFCRDNAAIKDRSLLIKLQEYLPIGLSPVLVHLPEADPDGELTRGKQWPPM
ncbi:MAG: hypothetical protein JO144_13045, partial [Actinobacteria bacterium]|nr:hypothetical protein [Actinomycetota bacterium]